MVMVMVMVMVDGDGDGDGDGDFYEIFYNRLAFNLYISL